MTSPQRKRVGPGVRVLVTADKYGEYQIWMSKGQMEKAGLPRIEPKKGQWVRITITPAERQKKGEAR